MMLNYSALSPASCPLQVTFHHSRPGILKPVDNPPQEQTTWESLALASNFRPGFLARRCGVSLRTLERHFNNHYGITVRASLRQMRLSMAYTRLQHGESAKSVAYNLGYKQPSHFSRDFKNFYGVPPRSIQPPFLGLIKQRIL